MTYLQSKIMEIAKSVGYFHFGVVRNKVNAPDHSIRQTIKELIELGLIEKFSAKIYKIKG